MIIFKTIELQNFFSVGDNPLIINLEQESPVLVSGHNGAGKSVCIVDSLCWILFNKPYRKVNKSNIVNNINGKDCLGKITFQINDDTFKVVRGIKPNIFEIYKNDVIIDQSSNNKDYQKLLEENILRLNFDSFKQVVILSSSSFIPFMNLTAAQRRVIVEDILDIEIFSKMNSLLKEENNINQNDYHTTDLDIIHVVDKKRTIEDTISKFKANNDLDIQNRKEKIKDLNDKIEHETNCIAPLRVTVEKARDIFNSKFTSASQEKNTCETVLKYNTNQVAQFTKEINEANNWLHCNTCNQAIEESIRKKIIDNLSAKRQKAEINIENSKQGIIEKDELISKLKDIEKNIIRDEEKVSEILNVIQGYKFSVDNFKKEIKRIEQDTKSNSQISEYEDKLKEYENEYNELNNKFQKISETIKYHKVMLTILKDDGIKSKAIKQYIPIINKSVNEYLDILNFFVHFSLDENFNEEIKVRHRDPQTYDSLSQGEKQRIDLALLFTWRNVAKLKNSVNTNLLILDETFDSSLDTEGVDNLITILDTLVKDNRVFIISHKGQFLEDKINNHLIFEKKNNFTVMRKAK